MQAKKTGALITAALEFGAILSGKDPSSFETLGHHLGLAYQVVDDLIDEDGMVKVLGRVESRGFLETLHEKISSLIEELPGGAPKLKKLSE